MKDEKGEIVKVHPVAALYPMMPEEELNELAEDIKINGQLNPCVRDIDGTLLDGRNREEACKRKGIKPKYVTLNGQDAEAFIFGQNHKRRHMTQGQKAMVAAKAHGLKKAVIESMTELTREELADLSELTGVSTAQLSRSWTVVKHAPGEVDLVINGKPLEEAHKVAKANKAATNSQEKQITKLQAEASDLAHMVAEKQIGLAAAILELNDRKEKAKKESQDWTEFLRDAVMILDPRAAKAADYANEFIVKFDSQYSTEKITKERLLKCVAVLKEIAKHWKDETKEKPNDVIDGTQESAQ